jgi:hypothetical protein
MKNISKILSIALLLGFVSCKKDTKEPEPTPTPTPPAATTGSLTLEFEQTADTNALVLGQKYKNANGDSVKIDLFQYYISNIVVTKDDNSTYVEPESYHIVKAVNGSNPTITLTNVPIGSYKSVKFTLGVDSARNVSGAQTGDLDPAKGMFWTWSTGYIFLKLEGSAPNSGASNKSIIFHVGGFSGPNKAQRNFNFNFVTGGSTNANVSASITPEIHLTVDALELFKTPTTINIATQFNSMMSSALQATLANNYADLIKFEHVHN